MSWWLQNILEAQRLGRRESGLPGTPDSLGVEVTACRAAPGLQGSQKVEAVGQLAVRAPVVDAHGYLGAAPGGQAVPTLPRTWSSSAAPGTVPLSKGTAG